MGNKIGLLKKSSTALLVIDVQERLMPVIDGQEQIFLNVNKLIEGAQILGISTVITEQYPRGLGKTCQEIKLPENPTIIEKICFSSMLSDEVKAYLKKHHISSLIICGVEAHICVLKTTLDALDAGFEVHVIADAVSSRTKENKQIALERMRQSRAFIASTEMVLFQLMNEAGTAEFKAISQLIK
ncbi:MAG: hydrolase [Chitinophagales bacterium]|nr:hydrolase [Chitinophagales bacterium]